MNNKSGTIQQAYLATHILKGDHFFPNNEHLPLLVYKGALFLHPADDAAVIEHIFEKNNWTNSWRNGIYDYHHYHSTTHEVLGVFCGRADVQLGGPEGVCVELVRGDVLIIPAGVAHKNVGSSEDFLCIGAYPDGRDYDINYGKKDEHPRVDENIKKVPLPEKDPVYGNGGHLQEYWVNPEFARHD